MAVGTDSGLLDHHKSQSIFKHAILKRYLEPYAAMVGSKSPGNRVSIVDGFAGRGRDDQGKPGSAEVILQTALNTSRAVIEATLVEKNRADYARLSKVVDEYRARGVCATAHRGDVQQYLGGIIEAATALPLFLFLDPCGANLPYTSLARVLASERRPTRPSTEVLLNFSADFTRRAAGALAAGQEENEGLSALDRVCGGRWWRQVALDARGKEKSFERSADAVAQAYTDRLAKGTGMRGITVPVRRKIGQQPVYHLVFLTRSSYGVWVFADALAGARHDWLRALGPQPNEDDGLFTFEESVESVIASEQQRASQQVKQNIMKLIRSGGETKLVDGVRTIFESVYGLATEKTIAAAVQSLAASGHLRVLNPGKRIRERVITPV